MAVIVLDRPITDKIAIDVKYKLLTAGRKPYNVVSKHEFDDAIQYNDGWMLDRWFPHLELLKLDTMILKLHPDVIERYNFDTRIVDALFASFSTETQERYIPSDQIWSAIREKVSHRGYTGLTRLAFQQGATITDESLMLCCYYDTIEVMEEVLRWKKVEKSVILDIIEEITTAGYQTRGSHVGEYWVRDKEAKVQLLTALAV